MGIYKKEFGSEAGVRDLTLGSFILRIKSVSLTTWFAVVVSGSGFAGLLNVPLSGHCYLHACPKRTSNVGLLDWSLVRDRMGMPIMASRVTRGVPITSVDRWGNEASM